MKSSRSYELIKTGGSYRNMLIPNTSRTTGDYAFLITTQGLQPIELNCSSLLIDVIKHGLFQKMNCVPYDSPLILIEEL